MSIDSLSKVLNIKGKKYR